MHHQFMIMTDRLVDSQLEMLKMHEAMLNNYKKLLKLMMDNDMGTHN